MDNTLGTHMVRGPFVADPDMSPREALETMRELEFRHLPVVRDGRLVGIVSERDLREAVQLPQAKKLRLEDMMKTGVFWVQKETPLKKVVFEMADKKYGSAIVLNDKREVIGIFTTTDALRILGEILDESGEDDFLLDDETFESWEDLNSYNA